MSPHENNTGSCVVPDTVGAVVKLAAPVTRYTAFTGAVSISFTVFFSAYHRNGSLFISSTQSTSHTYSLYPSVIVNRAGTEPANLERNKPNRSRATSQLSVYDRSNSISLASYRLPVLSMTTPCCPGKDIELRSLTFKRSNNPRLAITSMPNSENGIPFTRYVTGKYSMSFLLIISKQSS